MTRKLRTCHAGCEACETSSADDLEEVLHGRKAPCLCSGLLAFQFRRRWVSVMGARFRLELGFGLMVQGIGLRSGRSSGLSVSASSIPMMTASLAESTEVLPPQSSHHEVHLARHAPEVDLRKDRAALAWSSCSSKDAASCPASGNRADSGNSHRPNLSGSAPALQQRRMASCKRSGVRHCPDLGQVYRRPLRSALAAECEDDDVPTCPAREALGWPPTSERARGYGPEHDDLHHPFCHPSRQ